MGLFQVALQRKMVAVHSGTHVTALYTLAVGALKRACHCQLMSVCVVTMMASTAIPVMPTDTAGCLLMPRPYVATPPASDEDIRENQPSRRLILQLLYACARW